MKNCNGGFKNEKKKVLHIMSGYGGGISSFIRNLSTEIDSSKYQFDVISFTEYSDEFVTEIGRTNGKCVTIPRPKEAGFIHFFSETIKIINENGPYDIIESHLTGLHALVFKIISILTNNSRFVVHAHATSDDLNDNFKSYISRKFNMFISRKIANQLTSCSLLASNFMFGEQATKKYNIVHIPNSICLEKYYGNYTDKQLTELKIKNNIPLNKVVIGNIARFNPQKNHKFMLKLIQFLASEKIDFVWVFIGQGELENQIYKEATDLGLEDYVRFLGRREDANTLYSLMDVFVLPSFYEGLPTVIVEAQAAGIKSVVSDTITTEVDFGLKMVDYINLDEDLFTWKEAILKAATDVVPSTQIRFKNISDRGFSNNKAAKLYEKFIEEEIIKFTIGDKI